MYTYMCGVYEKVNKKNMCLYIYTFACFKLRKIKEYFISHALSLVSNNDIYC